MVHCDGGSGGDGDSAVRDWIGRMVLVENTIIAATGRFWPMTTAAEHNQRNGVPRKPSDWPQPALLDTPGKPMVGHSDSRPRPDNFKFLKLRKSKQSRRSL